VAAMDTSPDNGSAAAPSTGFQLPSATSSGRRKRPRDDPPRASPERSAKSARTAADTRVPSTAAPAAASSPAAQAMQQPGPVVAGVILPTKVPIRSSLAPRRDPDVAVQSTGSPSLVISNNWQRPL
jgi:hypothetical protein